MKLDTFRIRKILGLQTLENLGPANIGNSKIIILSFFCIFFAFGFVILDLCCHFFVIFCHFFVISVSCFCHLFVILLSFYCHFGNGKMEKKNV